MSAAKTATVKIDEARERVQNLFAHAFEVGIRVGQESAKNGTPPDEKLRIDGDPFQGLIIEAADPGRIVPPHGSGPGGPSWQPPSRLD
jgi:hypothetical protein